MLGTDESLPYHRQNVTKTYPDTHAQSNTHTVTKTQTHTHMCTHKQGKEKEHKDRLRCSESVVQGRVFCDANSAAELLLNPARLHPAQLSEHDRSRPPPTCK